MAALVKVLESDFADSEIISYAVDTLCNVMSPESLEDEFDNPNVSENIGVQFTEMFLKQPDNVGLILNLLTEYDFRVRWSCIKLFAGLLTNKTKEIQEAVLVSPMAISKLMDLLSDSRDVIRNEALLLLIQLTKNNTNIQKIVAFENAFDRLFETIHEEGNCDGGIVVQDCLTLMLNLLKNNTSNQQFFKEGSYIQRLAPMFELSYDIEEIGITPQKISNLYNLIQLARSLVCPSNSFQVVQACQKSMYTSGLLKALCDILMSSGIPSEILTETICCVADVIRGNKENQQMFDTVMAPSNPPKPAIVILLMSMVNEKQPLKLRCAVLYCFQSLLYKNNNLQVTLVQTLLPSLTTVSTLSSGQLICGGLFNNDFVSNWFSAVALMHGVLGNVQQKEQLLRVLLATSPGGDPVSLLAQCTTTLQQPSNKIQRKIGILMLLATWLDNCEIAVKSFLTIPNSISFLTAQICSNEHGEYEYLIQGLCGYLLGICILFNDNSVQDYQKDDLCQLLFNRIGLETYSAKLSDVLRHEHYIVVSKQPQLLANTTNDLVLDYEFCHNIRNLEPEILRTVKNSKSGAMQMPEMSQRAEPSGIVGQLKDLIRQQDGRLRKLQNTVEHLEKVNVDLEQKLDEALSSKLQLYDQNTLLKAQIKTTSFLNNDAATEINIDRMKALEAENVYLKKSIDQLVKTCEDKSRECEKVKRDQDNLLELLADQVILIDT